MIRRATILVLAAVAVGACSPSPPPAQSPEPSANATRKDPSRISPDELSTILQGDLYSAIKQLRPAFLLTRGPGGLGAGGAREYIHVYVDGMLQGDERTLKNFPANDIKEVRHLSATEATQRFGTGMTMGAILVTRK